MPSSVRMSHSRVDNFRENRHLPPPVATILASDRNATETDKLVARIYVIRVIPAQT